METKNKLFIGNLDALRDWGHARDYVEAQWMMLQQEKPEDFVIATGKQYSVRDFIKEASKNLDMNIEWRGEGTDEVGIFKDEVIIEVDSRYFRPTEVNSLIGDPTKAKEKWAGIPK